MNEEEKKCDKINFGIIAILSALSAILLYFVMFGHDDRPMPEPMPPLVNWQAQQYENRIRDLEMRNIRLSARNDALEDLREDYLRAINEHKKLSD